MKILGVIPARFASTRFPGKPLVKIGNKTMIQHVYEQAQRAQSLSRLVVATDDERILQHVQSFGGEAMMTSETHRSGTDRCAEVVFHLDNEAIMQSDTPTFYSIAPKKNITLFDAVINIQGDEPFIDPSQIDKIADILRGGEFDIATLVKSIDNDEFIDNPNIVKAVFSSEGRAIYFSRSPIPYLRDVPKHEWAATGYFFKHIGLYGYKTAVLSDIARLTPSHLEKVESLEQLRWLEAGYKIGIGKTDLETIGIDTPEDLEKINQ